MLAQGNWTLLGATDSTPLMLLFVLVGASSALLVYLLWVCHQKGRLGWGLLGLVIPFLLLGAAIAIAPPESKWAIERYDPPMMERAQRRYPTSRCPFCAELIQRQAIVCRYCGRDLPE